MTKVEQAIRALQALPPDEAEEVAVRLIYLLEEGGQDQFGLDAEQWAEVEARLERGVKVAPADAITRLKDSFR